MRARERILEASRVLFNERGASNVTTNNICNKMGMSPGNLYYHFSSKEEILRCLFEEMCNDFSESTVLSGRGNELNIEGVQRRIFTLCETFWRYRFFHRELYILKLRDVALAKAWKLHLVGSLDMIARWNLDLSQAGVFVKMDNDQARSWAVVILSLANSHLAAFEGAGRLSGQSFRQKLFNDVVSLMCARRS